MLRPVSTRVTFDGIPPMLRSVQSGLKQMRKLSLRNISIFCLVVWATIWLLFLMIRFSSFDIRVVPGIGPIMLTALCTALLAPVAAIVLGGAAVIRQPGISLNWLALASAVAAFVGQGILFLVTRWQ